MRAVGAGMVGTMAAVRRDKTADAARHEQCRVGGTGDWVPDGTPCDDGDPCSQTATCEKGKCVGHLPVLCCSRGFHCAVDEFNQFICTKGPGPKYAECSHPL
jgi:hypothetical protein